MPVSSGNRTKIFSSESVSIDITDNRPKLPVSNGNHAKLFSGEQEDFETNKKQYQPSNQYPSILLITAQNCPFQVEITQKCFPVDRQALHEANGINCSINIDRYYRCEGAKPQWYCCCFNIRSQNLNSMNKYA